VLSGLASAQTDSIEDRLEMESVIARYSFAWDFLDAEAFAKLFTEDAVWEMYAFDADDPVRQYQGREEIRGFAEERKTRLPGIKSAHHQSGLMVLEMSEFAARSHNMLIITQQSVDEISRLSRPQAFTTTLGERQRKVGGSPVAFCVWMGLLRHWNNGLWPIVSIKEVGAADR
jgi:hypothetical protein